ncbi:MAG: NADH-quinone oxidoreductase subunit D [Myxococcales bacterium]|nr:NADH-quinone oxidoreductase subunit D [Myxococcales bacterium]
MNPTQERSELVLDPSHPLTHGSVEFRISLDDHRIAALDVAVGFLHRGFEKECEAGGFARAIAYTDRLNYHSATLSSTAYCLAVETLLGVVPSDRAVWLRMLAGELARVADHSTRLAATCDALCFPAAAASAIAASENVWDLLEALSGARVTHHYLRIGGVRGDLPEGFAEFAAERAAACQSDIAELERLTSRNRVFSDRLANGATIDSDTCARFSITGPILRAAGVPADLRKDEPYLAYDELDFDVPVGSVGDNCDRYLVCVEEMHQSLRIAEQCLARLAEMPTAPEVAFLEGTEVPAGQCYSAIESANGELGFFVVSTGGVVPYKVRCRAPSFFHVAALPEMLRGEDLEELAPTYELINAVSGECDR